MSRYLPIVLIFAAAVSYIFWDQSSDRSAGLEKRIKELEDSKLQDLERQRQLEQELASHKLAMEWEAIERERQEIEGRRMELEGENGNEKDLEALKLRKEELVAREAFAEKEQVKLGEDLFFPPGGRKLPKEADFPFLGLEAGSFADSFATSTSTIDYEYFDDALSPYGTWYDTDEYGSVWQPAACVDPNWRPYTRGHWVCSDRGWVWVSSEPFGWATYHYGRWALLQNRGWIWVPGTEWAPNWCSWRSNDTYIGWAPLPPETLVYHNSPWDYRVEQQYGIGESCYNFVRARHFGHHIAGHCVERYLIPNCLKVTKNITSITVDKGGIFCGGPGYHDLSKKLGRQLPYYQVHVNPNSYEHKNPAHLRSRVEGGRLLVAAPKIRKNGSIKPSRRLTGIKAERSKTADPQAIAAYRAIRQRNIKPAETAKVSSPTPSAQTPLPVRPVSRPVRPVATPQAPTRPVASRSGNIPNATVTPSPEEAQLIRKRNAEARLEAFRKMAREQRAIANAEKARRKEAELAAAEERENQARQQREEQEAQQKIAAQQTEREEMQRRGQEEAVQRQRDEDNRRQALDEQRRREEMARQQQEETQRRQQQELERQRIAAQQQQEMARRAREDAQRRQQEEARRQAQQRAQEEAQRRAREDAARRQQEEARRAREEAQRRQQQEAQRQAREQQRRSQEEAQRKQRQDTQRRQRSR